MPVCGRRSVPAGACAAPGGRHDAAPRRSAAAPLRPVSPHRTAGRPSGQPRADDLLALRIRRALAVAAAYGYETLALGAWGCGAFGNDPVRTARDFRAALEERAGHFAEVVFAISDGSPERRTLGPFRDAFG